MSKSLSELFSTNSRPVPLPVNENDFRSSKSAPADGSVLISDYDRSHEGRSTGKDIVDSDYESQFSKTWKLLGDTLGKYKMYKEDPSAYLSLFGGMKRVNLGKTGKIANKLNDLANSVGIDLLDSAQDTIPLPAHMSKEDGRVVMDAINTIKGMVSNAITGTHKTANYELIRMMSTNSGVLNKIINVATGDYIKREFDKGRLPYQIPNSQLNRESSRSIYDDGSENADVVTGSRSIGQMIKKSIKNYVNQLIKKGMVGQDAAEIIYGNAELKDKAGSSEVKNKYQMIYNPGFMPGRDKPFNAPRKWKDVSQIGNSINDVIKVLQAGHFAVGYKDFAGFEMGTNHDWMINIYPYDSTRGGKFPNRKSVVRGLPYYALPNLWSSVNQIKSTLPEDESASGFKNIIKKTANTWLNVTKDKIIEGLPDRLVSVDDLNNSMQDQSLASTITKRLWKDTFTKEKSIEAINNTRFFSFSENTPVISYDLSFGNLRTEQQKLFNGGAMETVAGMNFNGILNVAILDDVYCSMYKYMLNYINRVYSITSSSLAPYYSTAFEVDLIIFNATKQPNFIFRFICIPMDFSPRFDGSQEASNTRLDITFGIVGYIGNDDINSDSLYPGSSNRFPMFNAGGDTYQMNWDDIKVKMS